MLIANFTTLALKPRDLNILCQQIYSLRLDPRLKVLAYPITSSQALVWFSNHLILSQIPQQIQFEDQQVIFSTPENVPSSILSLTWLNDSHIQDQGLISLKLREIYQDVPIFSRKSGLLFRFPNQEIAFQQLDILQQSLRGPHGENLCQLKILNANEFSVLSCVWQPISRSISWEDIFPQILRSETSLTSMLQSNFFYWPEQPCLLKAELDSKGNEYIYILLPTQIDVELIHSKSGFEFAGGRVNTFPLIDTKASIHILWAFDFCPPHESDNVLILSSTINKIAHYFALTARQDRENFYGFSIQKRLYISELEQIYTNQAKCQIQSLISHDYLIHSFPRNLDLSLSLRSEVEDIIHFENFSSHSPKASTSFFLIARSYQDCAPALASLKLAGFNEIFLILGENSDTVVPLSKLTFSWQQIRCLATYTERDQLLWLENQFASMPITTNSSHVYPSLNQKDLRIEIKSPIMSPTFELQSFSPKLEYNESRSIQFETPTSPIQTEITNESYIAEVNLRCMSLATHFKQLVEWGRDIIENFDLQENSSNEGGGGGDGGGGLEDNLLGRKEPDQTLEHWTEQFSTLPEVDIKQRKYFLFGEKSVSRDYGPGDLIATTVSVNIDSKAKHYSLRIRSTDKEALRRRLFGLEAMYDMMLRNRKTYPMSMWDPQHRECMMGSQSLHEAERKFEAGALFHLNDGIVVLAEIVALSAKKHRNMRKFLEELTPRKVRWTLPQNFVNQITEKKWNHIKQSFSVKIEFPENIQKKISDLNQDSDIITLRCWGFGTLLDDALEYLKNQVQFDEVNSFESFDLKTTVDRKADTGIYLKQEKILGSKEELDCKSEFSYSTIASNKLIPFKSTSKPNKIVQGSFSFQDREAGIFYRAFEEEFKLFIETTFDVHLCDVVNQETSESLKNRCPDQQMRAAAIRIEFTGKQANVNAARAYFDQLNTTNLARFQIFFPVAEMGKYQSINKQKIHHDRILRGVRATITSTGGTEGVFPTTIVDPLKCAGFVNIRVKPPLHSRGIKRMIFPTDVMVTICGAMSTPEQTNIMQDLEKIFCEIKSDHFEATIKVPSTNRLAQTLTVRTSRQEFIEQNKLVSLRWEEGNKLTGNIGIARLWAKNQQDLDAVLKIISDCDVIELNEFSSPEKSLDSRELSESSPKQLIQTNSKSLSLLDLSPLSLDEIGGSTDLTLSQNALTFTPQLSSPSLPHTGNQNPPTPFSQPFTSNIFYSPQMNDWGQSSEIKSLSPNSLLFDQNSMSNVLVTDQLRTMTLESSQSPFSRQPTPQFGDSLPLNHCPPLDDISRFSTLSIEPSFQYQISVLWPNSLVRSVVMYGNLKDSFLNLVSQLENHYSIVIDPYYLKLRHNQQDNDLLKICVIIKGNDRGVSEVERQLSDFLFKLSNEIRCIELVFSPLQFQYLASISESNISILSQFETNHGVSLFKDGVKIFSSVAAQIDQIRGLHIEPLCCYDYRFNNQLLGYGLLDLEPRHESQPNDVTEQELVSIRVRSKQFPENDVEISILKSSVGWSWGLQGLLLILDRWTVGSTPDEEEKLSAGEVLVTSDVDGKVILRLRPDFKVANSIKIQAESYVRSLLKGLQTAETLQLSGIAINCSIDLSTSFTSLPNDIIRSITVENVFRFSNKSRVIYLKKIICMEEEDSKAPTGSSIHFQRPPLTTEIPQFPSTSTEDLILVPGAGNRMCLSLFLIFERSIMSNQTIQSSSPQYSHFSKVSTNFCPPQLLSSDSSTFAEYQLVHCSVPFPISLSRKLQSFTNTMKQRYSFNYLNTKSIIQIPENEDLCFVQFTSKSKTSMKYHASQFIKDSENQSKSSELTLQSSQNISPLSSEVRVLFFGLKKNLISAVQDLKELLR